MGSLKIRKQAAPAVDESQQRSICSDCLLAPQCRLSLLEKTRDVERCSEFVEDDLPF